uniref:Putative plant transposon protein domain-containing protein n=1 Tax=Solanum tuberosum TaxID=4113 RepID=M1DP51_SOLTU
MVTYGKGPTPRRSIHTPWMAFVDQGPQKHVATKNHEGDRMVRDPTHVVNHGVDYGPLFHRRTVLHMPGSSIKDPKLGTLTYGGDPQDVTPSTDHNVVTKDRAVMLETLVEGLEIDFAWILIAKIHDRALKTTTTFPFHCLIFHLCRAVVVPIFQCDILIGATKTMDIVLIRDNANLVAPWRDPQVDLPPLGTDLAEDVEKIQADETSIPPTTTDA